MTGFKITINNRAFLKIAPLSGQGVASVIISLSKNLTSKASEDIVMQPGTMDTNGSNRKISMWSDKSLSVGDKIVIEVTELVGITKPTRTEIENAKTVKKNKIKYYKQLKKELGI